MITIAIRQTCGSIGARPGGAEEEEEEEEEEVIGA
jgi:hypothetical protein